MVGDNIKDQLRSGRFKALRTWQNVATSSCVPASKTLTTMHSSLSMSLGAIDQTLILKHLSSTGGTFYGKDYWD